MIYSYRKKELIRERVIKNNILLTDSFFFVLTFYANGESLRQVILANFQPKK